MLPTDTPRLFERLDRALESPDDGPLRDVLASERAADIAEMIDLFDDDQRSRMIYAMPARTAAEVIVLLDEAVRGDVVDDLDGRKISQIVSQMPPDDAADVVSELDDRQTAEVLQRIEPAQSETIGALLTYPQDTAGGIMTPEVVAIPRDATVSDATVHVREATPDDWLNQVCIVDGQRRLVGVVTLRKLVTHPQDARLEDLCDPKPISVHVDDDQEQVVQIMRKYDLSEVPVVTTDGCLVGRITHDDILDVAEEEAAEDIYRMAGTDAAELESSSVVRAAGIRLAWILPCIGVTAITGTSMALARPNFSLAVFATLTFFVPMIAATSGNCGVQISTVIIRGFAEGDVAGRRLRRVLRRELRIVLVMAPACALVALCFVRFALPAMEHLSQAPRAATRGAVIAPSPGHEHAPSTPGATPDVSRVAIAVGAGMLSAVLVAATLGIGLPFAFSRVGVDPAISAGPLVTALNDVTAVTVYLHVAARFAM